VQVIKYISDIATVTNPELRQRIEATIRALSEDSPYDPDVLGNFLVVEPGDTLEALSAQLGFNIMANRWDHIKFGEPGFTPSFEFVESFAGWYDMVFVISDDGYGIELFVPKAQGVPSELIAMCSGYVFRSQDGTPP
jgi:hypothetical protein